MSERRVSYGVLSYHHNILTGERLNCALIFYLPGLPLLIARSTDFRRRIAPAFGLEEEAVRWAQEQVNYLCRRAEQIDLRGKPDHVNDLVASELLPVDDSAFQFHHSGTGLLAPDYEPQERFEELWRELVEAPDAD